MLFLILFLVKFYLIQAWMNLALPFNLKEMLLAVLFSGAANRMFSSCAVSNLTQCNHECVLSCPVLSCPVMSFSSQVQDTLLFS